MNGEERALALDAQDELAGFRERFYLPLDTIYLDGNSLGPLSREAEGALLQVLDEWKRLAIGGFLQGETPWVSLGERLGELQAPVVGAHPDEVVATGSTTVNLHQLMATFYQPEDGAAGCWPTSSTSPPTCTPCRVRCGSTAWTRPRNCCWCGAGTDARWTRTTSWPP